MRLRASVASLAVQGVNRASRVTGKGSGTVAGGRVGLKLDPKLLEDLARGRSTVLVSGTNGKTTTTALLTAALATAGPIATNATGSNMPPGHVAALVGTKASVGACLEVDEAWLPATAAATRPRAVVLLNLSRDQLDRSSEVRMLAERWRGAVASAGVVIANCDDPMVAWAASTAESIVWVAGGLEWKDDAGACPSCRGAITFDELGWRCGSCDLTRPTPTWWLDDRDAVGPSGPVSLTLELPGRFNRSNALVALAAADALGIDPEVAAHAMSSVHDVAGRFNEVVIASTPCRLMLAKNPAGWSALLDVVTEGTAPVVVAINSRTADGADPSWLFDVDFSKLQGRRVVATGDRWRDLSVRLRYAGVVHDAEADSKRAVEVAGTDGDMVEIVGNYTAFRDLLEASA